MNAGTIIVVDDERVNISLLKAILGDYTVLPALNAGELFAALEKTIPDIILLDIMLPGTDGISIARQLKNDPVYEGIPIIFLSAVTSGDYIADGFTLGAEDYIKKPFDSTELTARIKRAIENSTRQHELYLRATRDSLTGLYNREYFFEQLEMSINKWKRGKCCFSIGIIDIDLFKNINDTYGHQTGDRVLQKLSSVLLRTLRGSDLIARYGGEEFIFILSDSGCNESKAVIDRLRVGLAEADMDEENHIFITFSCGICDIMEIDDTDDPARDLVALADRRLYIAKNSGRNRTVDEG